MRNYHFALSECNNLIAMLNFRPDRAAELQQRIREGRVELCNAFFLEPDINLSGGEALVKCGVEGLRWQQAVWGVRPRLAWMIDVTGLHEQMAQITAGLGLEALAYCRYNPTGYAFHWAESPDGTRTLALSPGPYADWKDVFQNTEPLTDKQLADLRDDLQFRADATQPTPEEILKNRRPHGGEPRHTPAGAPLLVLAQRRLQPRAAVPSVSERIPRADADGGAGVRRAFCDAQPLARRGFAGVEVGRDSDADDARRDRLLLERVLDSMPASQDLVSPLRATTSGRRDAGDRRQPARPVRLSRAGPLSRLAADVPEHGSQHAVGAAGGMVFEHELSWDARDRFEAIEERQRPDATACGGVGRRWQRRRDGLQPAELAAERSGAAGGTGGAGVSVAAGARRGARPARSAADRHCGRRAEGGGRTHVDRSAARHRNRALPRQIDAATGSLASLVLKPGGQEVLGGPANVIVAEYWEAKFWDAGNMMGDRAERKRLADSSGTPSQLTVTTGPLATVVVAESAFVGGGKLRRTTFFYHDSPRIEFETELHDLPNATVVVAEFPLGAAVRDTRRGIPYGFSRAANGITPAVRWSHYQMAGAGVALLDQGLAGANSSGTRRCSSSTTPWTSIADIRTRGSAGPAATCCVTRCWPTRAISPPRGFRRRRGNSTTRPPS